MGKSNSPVTRSGHHLRMSPSPRHPRSVRASNSELYKFHRPKLRVRDTPHPLKWESELCVYLISLARLPTEIMIALPPQMPPQPLNAPYKASRSALPSRTQRRSTRGAVRRTSGRSLCYS